MSDSIQSFFTYQSFGTVAGASFAVVILTNTYRTLAKSDSPIPAFVASLLIAFFGAYQAGNWKGLGEAFLILLNACLLFCTALGIQEVAVGTRNRPPPGAVKAHGRVAVSWLSHWFKK